MTAVQRWWAGRVRWYKKLKPWQKIVSPLVLIIVAGVWIIMLGIIPYQYVFKTGVFGQPAFQIAALIEVGLSLLAYKTPDRRRHWLLFIFFIGAFAPLILAKRFNSLRSIESAFYIFLPGFMIASLFRTMKQRKPFVHQLLDNPLPFLVVLPGKLPARYKESSLNFDEKHRCAELVWKRRDAEYVIWLKQSLGPIPGLEPHKDMLVNQTDISGVPVRIEIENLKPSKSKRHEPPFIEANWTYKGLNFNLRSDGLTREKAEIFVQSLIQ